MLLGGAAAMSSTAIVIRELKDGGDINQPHGHSAIGILLFQDIAVVPFLVLIPIMAGSADTVTATQVLLAITQGFAAAGRRTADRALSHAPTVSRDRPQRHQRAVSRWPRCWWPWPPPG